MQAPENMTRIINRIRYSTATAELIADDAYWDGHNHERRGVNRFLYKTKKGAYFLVTLSQWQGSQDTLEPISEGEAIDLFEGPLTEHYAPYEKAFPDIEVIDA